jgi:regulator of sigma E protease
MGLFTTIIQVILSLSLLVVLHEGGHFAAAKFFKTKVEKFYLFFNPWFSLFKIKKGETEYGIGWLPFGGYVKIAGMIDESFDKKQLEGEIQPWEFRAKPAWQRLIIMLGGIIVNIILGVAIFIALTWAYGSEYIPNDQVTYGIKVDSIGMKLGLKEGDRILSLGDKSFTKFDRGIFISNIIINDVKTIKVNRNGKVIDLPVPENAASILAKAKDNFIISPRLPFVIDSISPNSAAAKAGFKKKDRIIKVNNDNTEWMEEVRADIKKYPDSDVDFLVLRNNRDTILLKAHLGNDAILGVSPYVPVKIEKYTLAQSIPRGISRSWNFISGQVKAFGKIISGKIAAKDSVGSVISMGKMFGDTFDAQKFWTLTGMLSLLLAFLNLLPIPGLDGGHAVFVIYEMITGRKPSDKFVEVATTIGFFLLIALMVFALGNDIRKLF